MKPRRGLDELEVPGTMNQAIVSGQRVRQLRPEERQAFLNALGAGRTAGWRAATVIHARAGAGPWYQNASAGAAATLTKGQQ